MNEIEEILNLLNCSYSPFHVVSNIETKLKRNHFTELQENEDFILENGGRYFVKRNGSSIIAFRIPENRPRGFLITASHTDSPTFKLKPNPIYTFKNLMLLNVEPYGGAINYSWLDRPLSFAGRVMIQHDNEIQIKNVCIDEDLLLIPSVAIHMNREINKSVAMNPAKDMIPVFGNTIDNFSFDEYLKKKIGLNENEKIISHDLLLYNRDKATLLGSNQEFISSPRLDDLASCYSSLLGFLEAKANDFISCFVAFDNEEVGSLTRQGANSTFLREIIQKISKNFKDEVSLVPNSIMLSIDNAHANHPNHPEYSDVTTDVELNKGIVIKYNANQKYTTDALSSAIVKIIAAKEGIQIQEYANRSDLPGGSTLGNISNSEVSLLSADIGLPQLAMHSSYELMGKDDLLGMIRLVLRFYSSSFSMNKDGFTIE